MAVLAIDAGTSGVTALVVEDDATVASHGYAEFPQHFPEDGWVEHDLDEIWTATIGAIRDSLSATDVQPSCIGVANQRETLALWDRGSLRGVGRAIVWQDRRTASICRRLKDAGHEDLVHQRTGLLLDPYFTATKLMWIRENEPAIWLGVKSGAVSVGTIDCYLIARMTNGRRHVTDPSNASRTLLYDIRAGQWSDEMCELFGVPRASLPEVVPTRGVVANTDPDALLGLDLPIAGMAGDQQAALFGQTCFVPGTTKCTYGTGSFVLTNTGAAPAYSESGLLTTVAWSDENGGLTYALEGAVFVTGAAVQWLRDGLQILPSAAQSQEVAQSVADSGGVVFVPALTGLGVPDWDPTARGAIFGLSRSTTRAHLVRATLDAIAFQVRDVVDLVTSEAHVEVPSLFVDGGASANDLLCQLQADQIGVPVVRPGVVETTALGAAFLAGLATGVWTSTDELSATRKLDRTFEPKVSDETAHDRWRDAVRRTKGWAT